MKEFFLDGFEDFLVFASCENKSCIGLVQVFLDVFNLVVG